MRRSLVLLAALAVIGGSAPEASASAPFRPCHGKPRVECARIDVALDRSGRVPGTIGLHAERRRSRRKSRGTVVALAGGPGEAAAPLLQEFAYGIRRALRDRDLIAFDQRGTGRSAVLRCRALERATGVLGDAIRACAAELGPKRAFYTTLDSAADVEDVRRALGVERIALYGTSYGVRVALAYAALYPTHVDRLVLDSPVLLEGPDPFLRDTFAALPRVLRALCEREACSRITTDPVADLASLVARLGRGAIRGRIIAGNGRPRSRKLGRLRLLSIVIEGDTDPSLRAELPAAVKATLGGDTAPILRLAHRASVLGNLPESPRSFSSTLYVATTCEESPLPWQPAASYLDRWARAISQAASLPDSAFYPFDRATARASDTLRLCAHWPEVEPRSLPPPGPLPAVPTLVLSGESDLRTPQETGARVAAQIPNATHLVVPDTGHSVIAGDLSGCAERAASRFLRGLPVAPRCPGAGRNRFLELFVGLFSRPTPLPPTSLDAVPRAPSLPGRPGRTLRAFELTLADGLLQALFGAFGSPTEAWTGGLRGGRVRIDGRFERYSYVPGVEVTLIGRRQRSQTQRFRVGGAAASRGVLRLNLRRGTIRGRLGKRRVRSGIRGLAAALLRLNLQDTVVERQPSIGARQPQRVLGHVVQDHLP